MGGLAGLCTVVMRKWKESLAHAIYISQFLGLLEQALDSLQIGDTSTGQCIEISHHCVRKSCIQLTVQLLVNLARASPEGVHYIEPESHNFQSAGLANKVPDC